MLKEEEKEEESECRQPCDPNDGCPECAEYWNRMVAEGFWNRDKHEWTLKGWREIIK